MSPWSLAFQYISIWHSKAGLNRQVWYHCRVGITFWLNCNDMKANLPPPRMWQLSEGTLMINLSSLAPAATLQTLEAAELSLFLQGNPLVAPKLHINRRRFKPILFGFQALHLCIIPLSLLAMMRAVHPPQAPEAPSHHCITSHPTQLCTVPPPL